MRRWRLAILGFALIHQIAFSQTITLRFAYEVEEVFPYYMGSGEATPPDPGVTPEMLRLLEHEVPGLRVQLQRMPWKRCLVQLQDGEVDAVVASFKRERQQAGAYPMKGGEPDPALAIDVRAYYLYKAGDSALNWNGQQFAGLAGAIGAPLGYSIVEDLQKKGASVAESRSAATDFQKLLLGRLAGVAAFEKVGDFHMRKARPGVVVRLGTALATKEYYLVFSHQFMRRHPTLAPALWRGLARIREQQADALFLKYLEQHP